jgi:ABC-type sugar transport system permease subunit
VKLLSRTRQESRAGWLMTSPALAAIGLFFVIPAVASLLLSFTDFDIYALADLRNLRFIGLQNYGRLIGNPLFWQAMANTMWFVIIGVPLLVSTSLLAALLVNAKTLRWRRADCSSSFPRSHRCFSASPISTSTRSRICAICASSGFRITDG